MKSGRKQQTQLKQTMIFVAILFSCQKIHLTVVSCCCGHIQVTSAVCGLGTLPIGDLGGLPKRLGSQEPR